MISIREILLFMAKFKDTWNYISSFGKEQPIAQYFSKIGPDIEVSLINGRYQINAGCVNYSYGPLHDAFRRYFTLDPPFSGKDSPVLILGFGGGSIATILRSELEMPNPIIGVELDEMMIKAGQEHFDLGKLTDVEIVIDDAFEFIQKCQQKFSLIAVDLYINDKVPEKFMQAGFIAEISRCLEPGGKLVFNKLVGDDDEKDELNRLETLFKGHFDKVKTFKIPVNKYSPNMMVTGVGRS